MIGDGAERVRQLDRRGRIGIDELAGQQRRRPDGQPEVVAGVGDRRGRRFDDDVEAADELVGDPTADRVVAAGEVPGVVGVEALDSRRGAADAAGRPGPVMLRREGAVALVGVALVGSGDGGRDRRQPPPPARPRPTPGG